MGTGKLAGPLYVLFMRLKLSVSVREKVFLENKYCLYFGVATIGAAAENFSTAVRPSTSKAKLSVLHQLNVLS
jgi:hypothetical protein